MKIQPIEIQLPERRDPIQLGPEWVLRLAEQPVSPAGPRQGLRLERSGAVPLAPWSEALWAL